VVGVKVTLSVTVPPAGSVYGVVIPEPEKELPLTLTWSMIVLAFPLLVRVIALVLADPVFTVPNAMRGLTSALCDCADPAEINVRKQIPAKPATRMRHIECHSFLGVAGLSDRNAKEVHVERQHLHSQSMELIT